MAYAVWHGVITDLAGNVVPLAQIEVRSERTGKLVRVYKDREGLAPSSNPFPADGQGQATFYVAGGAYRIIARAGPFERVWRYVGIGTAQEADIEELGEYLQAGLIPVQTRAALDAIDLDPDSFPMGGIVLADPVGANNGYYINQGSGWVYTRPLPDTFARLYVTGGSVDAVEATLDAGVNPSAPSVFFIDVSAANTGPVTLTINGANSGPVLNAAGNALSAGEWMGRVFFTRETDGDYRIVNDPASALAAATSASAAEVAKAAAVVARNGAQDSATEAGNSADAAAGSASAASGSATAAGNSADAAAGSALTAATKADEAAGSASDASGAAAAASNSAGAASTSAAQAAISEAVAVSGASSASASAGTATAQANRAEGEADRAEAAVASVDSPVSYKAQTLTKAEQKQARTNIAAGDVGGPNSAEDGHVVLFDGDTGKIIKSSGKSINDIGSVDELFEEDLGKSTEEKAQARANIGLGNSATRDVGTTANTMAAGDDERFSEWASQPIGVPVPMLDNLVGVAGPPTDKSYRYIKLTASDAYNDGALTGQSVAGTAPLVVATAVIELANSPINGQTVHLINTERRFLRAGAAGSVENDQMQQITGNFNDRFSNSAAASGALSKGGVSSGNAYSIGGGGSTTNIAFDSALSSNARAGIETRSKNIGVTYFMRIL